MTHSIPVVLPWPIIVPGGEKNHAFNVIVGFGADRRGMTIGCIVLEWIEENAAIGLFHENLVFQRAATKSSAPSHALLAGKVWRWLHSDPRIG